jgi:hypothetical protein
LERRPRKFPANCGDAPVAAGWLVPTTAVGWLRAGRRAVSAGGELPNGSRRSLLELTDGVAVCEVTLAPTD